MQEEFMTGSKKTTVGSFDMNTGIYTCQNPLKKGKFVSDAKVVESDGVMQVVIRKPKAKDIIEYTKHLDSKVMFNHKDGNVIYSNEYIEYDVYRNDQYFFEKLKNNIRNSDNIPIYESIAQMEDESNIEDLFEILKIYQDFFFTQSPIIVSIEKRKKERELSSLLFSRMMQNQ